MDESKTGCSPFYERFWADETYQFAYATDSARRDRLPAVLKVWGNRPLPATVLDFGCGNGVLTSLLKQNGFGELVVGVDISAKALAQARASFKDRGLRFQELEGFAAGDELYEVVVSSHVLEHLENPEAVLTMLARRGSLLILEVPLERCLWQDIAHMLTGKARHLNPVGHIQFWNREEFHGLLGRAGMSIEAEYHYASAPFSPYTPLWKRGLERVMLTIFGLRIYSRLMATHYAVLARPTQTGKTRL